jgi:zinc D-Ala-D-Ala carboxypeptidase
VLLTRLRPIALALVFGLGCFLGVVAQGAPVEAAAGSPPACRYDDVTTKYTSTADWSKTLVDTIYRLPSTYVPKSLVSTSRAGLKGGGLIRSFVIPYLADMAKAAKNAGAGLRVVSAYRSYATQVRLYQREVQRYGEWVAKHSVARPGHSEHQLGVTIDFGSAANPGDVSQSFAKTAAGRWMKANAWKYGWVMSYPRGATSETCYYSEPWHFRFVGHDIANALHSSGLTLRQYLWTNYQ